MDPHDQDLMRLEQSHHRNWLARQCDPGYIDPPPQENNMIANYIELAMRTNSTATGTNTAVTPDLLHATLGLCDEHFEYDSATSWLNAVEELGDLCWSTALAGHALAHDPFIDWETYIANTPGAPLLRDAVAEFVSLVKKSYAYGAPLDKPRLCLLLDAIAGRIALITLSKSNRLPDELLVANIEKLMARFPEKFTIEGALIRNIKQEAGAMRAVLH